jgi:5-methylcytosine-specific restriction enzyme A
MGLHGTSRWRRMAKHQLRVEPLCALCLRENRGPVPARIADHITPHHNDPNKFWLGKLQSLRSNCHESRKKFKEKHGYDKGCDVDGLPLDPNHPVYTGIVK